MWSMSFGLGGYSDSAAVPAYRESVSGPRALRNRELTQAGEEAWEWAGSRLSDVDALLDRTVSTEGVLGESALFHLHDGSKRLRAQITLSGAHSLGVRAECAVQVGAACELLHSASLSHNAIENVHLTQRYGSDLAVNLGDYLVSLAYGLLAGTPCEAITRTALISAFTRGTTTAVCGRSRDETWELPGDLNQDAYEAIARAKTGSLFALCGESVALLAGATSATAAAARDALEWFGVAYQIQDDLADLFGVKEGHTPGTYVINTSLSAPLVHYAATASSEDVDALHDFLRRTRTSPDLAETQHWIDVLQDSDSVARTLRHFGDALKSAQSHWSRLPIKFGQALGFGFDRVRSGFRLPPVV